MALFVVERYASAQEEVADADSEVMAAAVITSTGGEPVRHVRTWFLPEDETCFSLFEAPSAEVLRAAGAAAGLHYSRITEAIETSAGGAG